MTVQASSKGKSETKLNVGPKTLPGAYILVTYYSRYAFILLQINYQEKPVTAMNDILRPERVKTAADKAFKLLDN
jgi:hypothetical protein